MQSFSYYCPISIEQRPIYEYVKLKNSFLLSWPTLASIKYFQKLFTIAVIFFLINIPFINSFNISAYDLVNFTLTNFIFVFFELIFLNLYVLLNWVYVKDRLFNATVVYEESSWYDGKTWIKPPIILKQERLIAYYQIAPILIRLKKIIQFLILLIIINLLVLFIF